MNNFESFLQHKKIDPSRFKKRKPSQYEAFEALFEKVHPDSFVAQKLFLINAIRREFPWKDSVEATNQKLKSTKVKPRITPKIKK
jgi:hypothetical protein